MGSNLTKLGFTNCCRCGKKRKNRRRGNSSRRSVQEDENINPRPDNVNLVTLSENAQVETRSEEEILSELRNMGIISSRPGGVQFTVRNTDGSKSKDKRATAPRRLLPVKKEAVESALQSEYFYM